MNGPNNYYDVQTGMIVIMIVGEQSYWPAHGPVISTLYGMHSSGE